MIPSPPLSAGSTRARPASISLTWTARARASPVTSTLSLRSPASASPTQVGGGIRTQETVARYLDAGLERVVLGTAAVRDRPLLERLCQEQPEGLIVSLDARDGLLATDGWTQTSATPVARAAAALARLGVRRFVYTDIVRDGTLTEPNYEALAQLVGALDRPVIAAGGVATADQLPRLARSGLEAVIIGRALYDGRIALGEALAAAAAPSGG